MIQVFQQIPTETYLKMFGDVFEHIECENFIISVYPNEYDDFRYFSYVNGIHVRNGGTHIDVVVDEILVPKIKDKLIKKHKNIKPGDIKNKLQLVIMLKNLSAKFGGQTKDMLEVSRPNLRTYLSEVDMDKFITRVLKNKELIDPITEIFELKEKQRLSKELAALETKKPKKIKNEKFTAPSHEWKKLFICEGASASSGLMSSLGRRDYGYFELKGVPMNVVGTPLSGLIKNVEYKGLMEILDTKWSGESDRMTFDEVIFATDQDLDGFRIRGLLFGFCQRFLPHFLKTNKIKVLCTPLMLLKKGDTVIKAYFNFDEFDNKDIKRGYEVKYLKGLGSWTPQEFEQMLDLYTLDGLIHTYEFDSEAPKLIDDWLGSDNVLTRREYLQNNDFNINDL